MHDSTERCLARLAVAILLGTSSFTLQAQTAPAVPSGGTLEEVVVTAQRRQERLQDVPISVSAFSQEKMDSQGLRSIDDVTQLTPGVVFQRNGLSAASNYNDENSDISIRGIQSNAGTSTTGIYIDDTPIQTRHIGFGTVNPFPALFDLERVELLRGPQGTLFGAGSEGGTVRFVSPEPDLHTNSGYARSELGSTHTGDTSYEAGIAAGGPIVDNVLGIRASAYYRRDGGYVDRVNYATDQVTEPHSNWQETMNFRLAMKWAITERMSLTPSLYYQRLQLADTAAYWMELSDRQNGVFQNGNIQHNTSTDPFYLAAIKFDWDLGSVALVGNLSHLSRKQHALPDYTQFDRAVYGFNPRALPGDYGQAPFQDLQENYTAEFRLQSTDAAARLTWTAGLFFAHLDENETQRIIDPTIDARFTAAYGTPLCTPIAPCPNGEIGAQPIYRLIDKQAAVYGEATFKFTDKLGVTAGARISHDKFEGTNVQYGPFVGPGVNINNPLTRAGGGSATPVTPRLVVNYHPDSNNLFYASASKGYRVGGINQGLGTLCDNAMSQLGLNQVSGTYSSDSLWSYEIGSKSALFDRRLQINASLFRIDWKDIQQNVYLLSCGLQFVANLGQVRSQGGDIDVQLRPTEDLWVGFTAAHTDAKYTNTICGGPIVCTGPAAVGQPLVSKGDRLPGAPWTFTLSSEYQLPAFKDRRPYVRFDYHYATAQTALLPTQNPANGIADPTTPGLPLIKSLSLRAGMRWNGLDLSIFGQNLTNEHPLLLMTRDTGASDLYFARSSRPRTIGVTATYRY